MGEKGGISGDGDGKGFRIPGEPRIAASEIQRVDVPLDNKPFRSASRCRRFLGKSLGQAAALHAQNRFSVTRQLAYSMDEMRRQLDHCLSMACPSPPSRRLMMPSRNTGATAIRASGFSKPPRSRIWLVAFRHPRSVSSAPLSSQPWPRRSPGLHAPRSVAARHPVRQWSNR